MSEAAGYNEPPGNTNGRTIPDDDEGGSRNQEAKASPTSSGSHHHSHHPSPDVERKTPVAGMYGAGTARAAAEKLAAQHEGKARSQEAVNGEKDDGGRQEIPLETDTMLEIVQKKTLLHGTLEVWIIEAKHLPDMNVVSQKFKQCFATIFVCGNPFAKAKAKVKDNTQGHGPKGITSDPYAAVILAGARVARTRVIKNDKNPKWKEYFSIPVAHYVKDVQITIKTDDMIGAPIIGDVNIPVEEIIDGQILDGWYAIVNNSRKHPLDAQLHMKMVFQPAEKNALYQQGVQEGEHLYAIPNAYFPCRIGGNITLYQDAHIMDGSLPEIALENGEKYHHRQAWEDLCTAILDAHHMVYITGWSIFTKVKLLRDTTRDFPEGGDLMLGDLLKRKSAEGVRVLVLAWDDKTSHSSPFLKTEGMMGVHDETTKNFFRNSSVRCVLAPRYASHKLSWFRQQVVGTLFTHHQKLTIVDAQGPGNKRTLISFIGGLDLCDGRWDTPSHSLFSTLETLHKDDFHSPTFSGMAEAGGPRQPWHDWHCKIEGPAVYDTLTNFEQRWRKATRWHDDELIQIGRISWILSPKQPSPEGDPRLFVTNDDAPNSWHVQVLRSIDSGSAKGFPKNVQDAQKQHLVWGKGVAIDISIQMAYIKAIRCAQHFIYIENQYFIGSSYNWPDYSNAGANHLIPMELALKVASKIRQGQRFAVYVVLPMWPEGTPDSASMQEILYFQVAYTCLGRTKNAQTIKMMYGVVAQALRDVGKLNIEHPRDYLNFYCLGNRETKTQTEIENPAPNPPDEASKHGQVQKYRRFMVYVHAKGIVVDDEYIICGSANINQRSMDGSRDTEIAMGGYQPYYTWSRRKTHPLGQIYGFRMSLWTEHLGVVDPIFKDPASLECVQRVNKMAEDNWEQYLAEEVTDMKGHLMPYPFLVNHDGTIGSIPGHETFPDVGGSVLGTNQPNIPDSLTT